MKHEFEVGDIVIVESDEKAKFFPRGTELIITTLVGQGGSTSWIRGRVANRASLTEFAIRNQEIDYSWHVRASWCRLSFRGIARRAMEGEDGI